MWPFKHRSWMYGIDHSIYFNCNDDYCPRSHRRKKSKTNNLLFSSSRFANFEWSLFVLQSRKKIMADFGRFFSLAFKLYWKFSTILLAWFWHFSCFESFDILSFLFIYIIISSNCLLQKIRKFRRIDFEFEITNFYLEILRFWAKID